MNFTVVSENNTHTYALMGSLIGEKDGLALIGSFEEHLRTHAKAFVFDLPGLVHVNSSGLGVMIELLNRSKESGATLVLKSPTTAVHNLLKITKLDTLFTIE